jgi:Flp pilus assembly protein TadD
MALELRRTRLGQLLQATFDDAVSNKLPRFWTGLQMFQEHQVRADDPRLRQVRGYFRRNLEAVVRLGLQARAQVVLCTVASNLGECAPFGSLNRADLLPEQLLAFEGNYTNGVAQESAGKWEEAVHSFRNAAAVDGSFAALHFRLGRCLLPLGSSAEARTAFARARDFDTLRFRSDSTNNEIIRELAAKYRSPGVTLLDFEKELAARSSEGVPGQDFFWEHVHFNFSGTYALAANLARHVARLLPNTGPGEPAAEIISQRECARRLGYSRWHEQRILAEILHRQQAPPCTFQLDHQERLERLEQKLKDDRRILDRAALLEIAANVREVIAMAPSDWVLHKHLAQLLENAGEYAQAAAEWERVSNMVPHYANARYHLGNILDLQGRSAEAEQQFRQALDLDPGMAEAWSGLGLSLAARSRFEEAYAAYTKAVEANPGSIHAYINWGLALAKQGRFNEAITRYQDALRINPDDAITHNNLGLALAATGQGQEALRHYTRALQLRPEFLLARINLGHQLRRSGRAEEALLLLEAGRALKPDEPRLRIELAAAYEQLGRIQEAVRELNEALRLNPNSREAREGIERLR